MGLVSSLTRKANYGPSNDYWYTPRGYGYSQSGEYVTEETAMRLAAVYACVRVVSEDVGKLPLHVYRRLTNGGKERATNHPLYDILHSRPNQSQTAKEFREMMQARVELRGNAYAFIKPGVRGAVDSLEPIHPDKVKVTQNKNGTLVYEVTGQQSIERFVQDQIFHLRSLSLDGIMGMSTLSAGADVFGRGIAAQGYSSRFLKNDATPPLVIQLAQAATQEVKDALREQFLRAHTGANRGKPAVVQGGVELKQLSINNKDAQFLELFKFSRTEIASMFRVPPHKIGDLERATFSNIEQQSIEYVVDGLMGRLVMWEQAISRDLISAPQVYFAEFLVDGLLRGDIESRYGAYSVGITHGWLNPNDVRRMENMNPIEGGDEYKQQAQMLPLGTPPPEPANERAMMLAVKSAQHIVRKEVEAVRRSYERSGSQPDVFRAWLDEYYSNGFVGSVTAGLLMSPATAQAYANGHRMQLRDAIDREAAGEGLPAVSAAIAKWEQESAGQLAKAALQEQ